VAAQLEKKSSLCTTLQEVARSLQSKNRQLLEQLDLRAKQSTAENKYRENMEGVVQQIKDRPVPSRQLNLGVLWLHHQIGLACTLQAQHQPHDLHRPLGTEMFVGQVQRTIVS